MGAPGQESLTPWDTLPLTLGSRLLLAASQRQSPRPGYSQQAPAPGLPTLRSAQTPPSAWRLHLCATGLLNRPCSPFSACLPSSSSPGIRSSSLAGPASSPLGETWGTWGWNPAGKILGGAFWSWRGSAAGGAGLGVYPWSRMTVNSSFLYPQNSLGSDDKTYWVLMC